MAGKRPTDRVGRVRLGRNAAVRPGGGPHKRASEKRAADKARREIEEQRGEAEGPDAAVARPTPAARR